MKSVLFFLLTLISLHAEEPWTLADGKSIVGQVKLVTPGAVIFSNSNGADVPMEITKLSAASRQRLIEVLGLNQTEPSPTTVSSKPFEKYDSGAIDARDVNMIDSQFGLKADVIGIVKEVVTLGSTGHKRINFEGTDFNVFISKRRLENLAEWKLDTLAGQKVQMTGEVSRYQEVPQMQLTEPSQIRVLKP